MEMELQERKKERKKESVLGSLKSLVSFKGRIGRFNYFRDAYLFSFGLLGLYGLGLFLFLFPTELLKCIPIPLSTPLEIIIGILFPCVISMIIVFSIMQPIIYFAAKVKRLRDLDYSLGLLLLLLLGPIAIIPLECILLFVPGKKKEEE